MTETMDLGPILVVMLFGGFVAGAVANSRGLSFGGYFVLGFLLPLIGILLAAVAPMNKLSQLTPAQSEGWWPDPTGRFDHRYYDGRTWTRFVGRGGQPFEDAL